MDKRTAIHYLIGTFLATYILWGFIIGCMPSWIFSIWFTYFDDIIYTRR